MIYSVAEWLIRKRLLESNQYVPNQLKKPTQKPTLKWIAFMFLGVTEVNTWLYGEKYQKTANLNEIALKIIKLLDQNAKNTAEQSVNAECGFYDSAPLCSLSTALLSSEITSRVSGPKVMYRTGYGMTIPFLSNSFLISKSRSRVMLNAVD